MLKGIRTLSKVLLLAFVVTQFIACRYTVSGDDDVTNNHEKQNLSIKTRSASEEINYPVEVYAFNSKGECVEQQVIETAEDELGLNLAPGSYRITAITGSQGYYMPDTPARTATISMLGSNNTAENEALMIGHADIIIDKTNATADITLTYRVAWVSLTLSGIPEEVTAVSVDLGDQYTHLTMDGTASGQQNSTIPCQKVDNVWKSGNIYTFGGTSSHTVLSITLTDDKGTHTYGYTSNHTLEAGTPYQLNGNYLYHFTVNGVLVAMGWNDPVVQDFEFGDASGTGETTPPDDNQGDEKEDEKGEGGEEGGEGTVTPDDNEKDTYIVTSIPKAGELWDGHVVVLSNATSSEATLLLISQQEWQNVSSVIGSNKQQAANYVAAYEEGDLKDWRIPTEQESVTLRSQASVINAALKSAQYTTITMSGNDSNGNGARYLCEMAGKAFQFSTGGSCANAGASRTYYLRAVKTVTVKKQ